MGSSDSYASGGLARLRRSIRAALATVCFWLAVVLPLAYVPLLVGGLPAAERSGLVGLLVVHAVVRALGHEDHDVPTGV